MEACGIAEVQGGIHEFAERPQLDASDIGERDETHTSLEDDLKMASGQVVAVSEVIEAELGSAAEVETGRAGGAGGEGRFGQEANGFFQMGAGGFQAFGQFSAPGSAKGRRCLQAGFQAKEGTFFFVFVVVPISLELEFLEESGCHMEMDDFKVLGRIEGGRPVAEFLKTNGVGLPIEASTEIKEKNSAQIKVGFEFEAFGEVP